jgi:two-component sensor histidine kinase
VREHHRQAEAVQRVQREEDHRSGHQDPEEGHQCQEEDHRGQAAVRQGQEEDHQGQGEDREEGRIARALWLASLPPCRALKSFAREERTLLRELTHRISNELVSSISIVSAAAVRADNPEVKVALSNVVDLLQQHADLHRALTIPNRNGLVDAAEYIRKLGLAMSRCCLEPIGIRLALVTDTLPLESEKCWRLALAVHELVANAARHACFDGRD